MLTTTEFISKLAEAITKTAQDNLKEILLIVNEWDDQLDKEAKSKDIDLNFTYNLRSDYGTTHRKDS